jgi:hypothetical protein
MIGHSSGLFFYFFFFFQVKRTFSLSANLICVPAGQYYSCTTSFSYTGPFSGEQVNISSFSAFDGYYQPVTPLVLSVNTTSVLVASSTGNIPYYPYKYVSGGNCTNAAVSQFSNCGSDYSGTVNAPKTFSLCNGVGASAFSPLICSFNNGGAYYGVDFTSLSVNPGTMYIMNITQPSTYLVNASFTNNFVSYSILGDITTTLISGPLTVSGGVIPSSSLSFIPFFWDNGTNQFIPTSSAFTGFSLDYYWYDRDPYNELNITVAGSAPTETATGNIFANSFIGAQGGVSNAYFGLYDDYFSRYSQLCFGMKVSCSSIGSPSVIRSRAVTSDILTLMPSTLKKSLVGGVAQLISTGGSLGNITATFSFTALYNRLPPAVVLNSYTADSNDGWVAVYGINNGNAGPLGLTINYTRGPPSTPEYQIGTGVFTITIESGRVASVCAATSCLAIIYPVRSALPDGLSNLVSQQIIADSISTSTGAYALYIAEILGLCITAVIILVFFAYLGRRFYRNRRVNKIKV